MLATALPFATERAHGSAREEDDITCAIRDVSAGMLWKPKLKGVVHPYIGFGLANLTATITVDTGPYDIDDNESSLGYDANAGVDWRLGKRFNLGVDARLLRGTDGEVLDVFGDADYFQAGLVLGFGWGK
ncbi:MAG: outer membrane beta-barrel protein [Acidobacteriota bacterium]